MRNLVFIVCLLLWSQLANAQKIAITEEPVISQMMKKFVEVNKQKKSISGWRIQISSTTDRRMMEDVVKRFQQSYAHIPVSWIHAKPYYQVRVGAFKTKLESLRLLSLIKAEYPEAYPVMDNNIKQADLAGAK
jgi:hypothetical protein